MASAFPPSQRYGGPTVALAEVGRGKLLVAVCLLWCATAVAQPGPPQQNTGGPVSPKPRDEQPPRAAKADKFRVCSDPQNMPFSNDRLEGFENRIAALIAKDFDAAPTYIWWGQRRGFIRNTMNATLEEGRCDVVIGVPAQYDLVRTTKPYYRSTYVFVYPKSKGWTIASLDDPRLRTLKIGVHLLGDDYTNPPPVHELSKRGVVDNVIGFNTFYSETNPPSAIVDAVASGRIDVAIVWGPVAGYYAKRQRIPLVLTPIPSGKGDLPFTFDISMGVKKDNKALYTRVEQVLEKRRPEITQILNDYGVPLVSTKAATR